jgi:hypothetical protein
MPQCQRRDCRRRLEAAAESVRQLVGIAEEVLDRHRRVIAPIDAHGGKKRMRRVFPKAVAGQRRLRSCRRVDQALPSGEAPGTRAEEDTAGEPCGECARLRVHPLELRRGRIGLFRRCDVEQRELIAHAAIVACGATAVWSSVGARAVDRALQLPSEKYSPPRPNRDTLMVASEGPNWLTCPFEWGGVIPPVGRTINDTITTTS